MNNTAGKLKAVPWTAVIWDMDGVIADTAQPHFLSWQVAFRKRGVDFSEADFKRHFGQRNDTIIRGMMGPGVPQDELNPIAEDKEVYFRESIVKDLRPFPGVVHLLKSLQENGISCAVASSAPLENVRLILTHLKIDGYFKAVVYGQEVSEGKPSPQVFLMAAKKLGVQPENCLVVEDAIAGVMAAKSAGMLCLAVTNTHSAEHLSQADLIVDSLEKVTLDDLNKLFAK
jgi:beta-phosphoglucomutase family hydrolase